MSHELEQLFEIIQSRRGGDPTASYVASLERAGLDKILEKIGEEAVELIIAAKKVDPMQQKKSLVSETADLWFHTLVLLAHNGITPTEVFSELKRREGTSGIEEKRSRPTNKED